MNEIKFFFNLRIYARLSIINLKKNDKHNFFKILLYYIS